MHACCSHLSTIRMQSIFKSVNKDSAFRKQHSPAFTGYYSHLKKNWSQCVYKMFGGQTRCIKGDVQMANRASSRLWVLDVIVGVKEKGVISKGTGGCPALSFATVVKKSKWPLQHDNFISFIPLATPMFEKQKTIKTLSYVGRTKTSPLAFCHEYCTAPEMIPKSTPKWSPINSWNGTCIPSRNYYKSVAAFTFLNRV